MEMFRDRYAVWTEDKVRPAPSFSPLELSPTATSTVEPFERQVGRAPDRIALKSGGTTITYRSLNSHANSVARTLLANRKGGHPLVALAMGHSPLKVIAVIGILKAGLGYVALDETAGDVHLLSLLSHCGAPLVVTDREYYDRLCDLIGSKVEVALIDTLLQRPSEQNLSIATRLDQISHIAYTSGSTGTPKGVIWTVANDIFNTVSNHNAVKLGAEDTIAFLHGFWTAPLMGALYCGAALSLFDLRRDGFAAMKRWLRRDAITQYSGIVTGFRQFLDTLEPEENFPEMRVVSLTGEPLFSSDLDKFESSFGEDCKLVNSYASTEQHVMANFVAGNAFRPPVDGIVPIGFPVDGLCMELVDENLDPVPEGAVGEIAVSCPFLTPGYWQDPERTDETFVWREDEDQRCYLTGDLARRDACGCYHLLGRKDDQIKIRGYRLLSSEIECAVNALEGVRESAVVPFDDGFASERLACYYVSESGKPLEVPSLRASLCTSLPPNLIPDLFLIKEDLPRTSTGKLKRDALPRPSGKIGRLKLLEQADRVAASKTHVAPQNKVERILVRLWSDILGRASVSTHDSFFEIGGNSLLALLFTARAQQLDLVVKPRQVFERQTIAELAKVVGLGRRESSKRENATDAVPLAHNQCRYLDRGSPNPHHWNVSVSCESRLELDPTLLKEAFADVIDAHEALSFRFALASADGRRQLAADVGELPLQTFDLPGLDAERTKQFIADKVHVAQESLNLARGPVLRLLHFKGGPKHPDQIVLIVHHLVCDAFSLTILLDDLQHAYLQRLNRSPLRLPAVGTPYSAWVQCLHNYANSEAGERCARQWLALPWSDVRPLPRDLPGDPADNTNAAARAVHMEWSLDETTKLLEDPRFTAQELLLAALHSTLANWMKYRTVLIDLLQHGRDPVESEMDLSRTVGMFIGYAPALLTSDPRDPKTHLQQIVDQVGELPHLPWSLDVFRHLSDPERLTARCKALPCSEVLFHFRGQPIGCSQEAFLTIVPNRFEGDHSPSGRRDHELSVVFDVIEGRLKGTMVYCKHYHRRKTIEDLCHQFRDRVSNII